MNCRDFEVIMTTFAREHTSDGITSEQAQTHIEACGRCAARLAEERALLSGVRAVVEEIACQGAPPRVETALLLALRERAAGESGSQVLRIPQTRGRTRWMWAVAAAAILALVSTILVSWLQARSPNENKAARVQPPALPAPTTPTAERVLPGADTGKLIPETSRRRRTVRRAVSQHEEGAGEIATDFLPLLDGDDLDALEGSQLVRIELPGSALIAVGLPVDAEMASASVKADVLLGHNGLARAIRFVR